MRTGCVPVSGTFMFYLSTPNYLLSHLYTFICVHNPKTSLNISTILTTKPIIATHVFFYWQFLAVTCTWEKELLVVRIES